MTGPLPVPSSRADVWRALDAPWDVVVVGGGINGAGVLHAAARAGLRALLLEQRDVAWGTSSRSSKLVHGGLRYLAQGHVGLTRQAVRERDRLLRQLPQLVEPVPFVLPFYAAGARQRLGLRAALRTYAALGGRVRRQGLSRADLAAQVPSLQAGPARGALHYTEGRTDDARLVLDVLRAARAAGGVVVTDAEVTGVVRRDGRVAGARVVDRTTGRSEDVRCRVLVNATGAWADRLREQVGGLPRMRPVRGSHLLFARERLPLPCGVVVRSPRDGRPVSVLPWLGATIVGTTDLDHTGSLSAEPAITSDEVAYLLECLEEPFRPLGLTPADVRSTWSGVRPLVASGAARSSDELRGHVVWDERGLLTAAGGKLTTFQALARDVLRAARPYVPPPDRRRSAPRHGDAARERRPDEADEADEADRIEGTVTTWAELRRAALEEAPRSLDDLLLRRTRLGLLLPAGGEHVLEQVRSVCAPALGWDDVRWQQERRDYLRTVRAAYGVPSGTSTGSAAGSTSTSTGSGPTGSPSA